MVTYDVELFKNLLFRLQPLIKTNITFYDENFTGTAACTSPMHPLCRIIKSCTETHCADSDTKAMTLCKNDDCADHHYACHIGMTEMAFRMTNHNETYGYILVGPFRDKKNEPEALRALESFSEKYSLDLQAMRKAYYATTSFSLEKFESIKVILHALFDYAVNKNIIAMKHTLFETVITAYVNEHLSENLSLDSLCRHFYLSPKQLHSVIKKATGLPPKQYVIQQRIAKAKTLITTTDVPIQNIAEAVGIPDYSYFIKVFKSITGHTPTHFRKQQK